MKKSRAEGKEEKKEEKREEKQESKEKKWDINKIFDSFIKQTIFKNKIILQSNYTPEAIPHREKQINQVASVIAPALRAERPSNLFIYGLTGTGKTLVIQFVRNQLMKRANDTDVQVAMPYINCKLRKVADTEYRILSELIKKLGGKVPTTGLPTGQIYQKFVELIDSKKQVVIFILDEIDQAVNRIGDEFLYNFTRINTELNQAQICLIGISNDLKFIDTLDPRIRSSLGEEEILFPPYNALQLQEILKKRASEAFKDNIIGEGVIEKCAAYAAREHGDARRALDLLRIAGELVERDGNRKINLNYIDEAKKKIESDKIIMAIETQPKQFQLVLYSIIEVFRRNKRQNNNDKIFTGDIYNIYGDLCTRTKSECLTQRRISDIISEFDMLGIINAEVISKGRYGRTRQIRIDLPIQLVDQISNMIHSSLSL